MTWKVCHKMSNMESKLTSLCERVSRVLQHLDPYKRAESFAKRGREEVAKEMLENVLLRDVALWIWRWNPPTFKQMALHKWAETKKTKKKHSTKNIFWRWKWRFVLKFVKIHFYCVSLGKTWSDVISIRISFYSWSR